MDVLVTGGAGYIGSTICSALMEAGHRPIILDSLVKGRQEFTKEYPFYCGDIADKVILSKIFQDYPNISAAIHCAALIVVPESVKHPFLYYQENVSKSNAFFYHLQQMGCQRVVFSSSASMYQVCPQSFGVQETSPLEPQSPYAKTKYMMEMILQDFCKSYDMKAISLRYFNPIGADPLLRTGPYDRQPTHILGRLIEVAEGRSPCFEITGTQWPTRDGSGLRDYVHVWDLALAHVKAIENFDHLFLSSNKSYMVLNLGSSRGVTVKEMLKAFQSVIGRHLLVKEVEARPGDVAGAYADSSLARACLNWASCKSLEEGISDALAWNRHFFKGCE